MRHTAAACLAWVAVAGSATAAAQAPPASRPGPYVVDVRAGVSALPVDPSFFPVLPSGTLVPSSGLAMDIGGHVYLVNLGPARIGLGANVLWAGGSRAQAATGSTTGSTTSVVRPPVESRLTVVAPQLSLNFGTGDGWSYVSLGGGRAAVRTIASGVGDGESGTGATTDRSVESGALGALNIGGGARWFMNRHLAFSFDVRFHILSSGSGETPTPKTTVTTAVAGISLR